MARKIVTVNTPNTNTNTNTTPATGTPIATVQLVAQATGAAWAYPAQPVNPGAKGRGCGQGTVGAALLAALANGPVTLAAAQAAIAAVGCKGAHPAKQLCSFITKYGNLGIGFACTGNMLSMHTYTAPVSQG
jgi:hypothetical protein